MKSILNLFKHILSDFNKDEINNLNDVVLSLREDINTITSDFDNQMNNLKLELVNYEEYSEKIEEELNKLEVENVKLNEVIKNNFPKGDIALNYGGELLWVDKNYNLSENFKVYEFMQNDGLEYLEIDKNIINSIQKIREHYGKPITITSGYRSKSYNESIGGASKSQHITGNAIDFKITGIKIVDIQNYIKENWKELGITGLGIYDNFTHIDSRESNKLILF